MKEILKKFIPPFLLNLYHFLLALLGAIFYRFPSKKLKVIGVTGTNGKTTVTEMIAKIFEKAGYKVALLNSIRFKIGDEEKINTLRMTMPGRFFIQKFLRKAVEKGCQYAILEVTSEGIKQHRHKFINFEVAVFTNLSPEHIESHGGFENYRKAKGKLFQMTKNIHVINADDANANYFLQFPAEIKYQFKIENSTTARFQQAGLPSPALFEKGGAAAKGKITIQPQPVFNELGCPALIQGLRQNSKSSKEIDNFNLNLKLPGDFNIYNALAAICVGLSQGISFKTCKEVLENFEGVPGRMEEVISKPFKVIVDYAFTPNALEKVYETIKSKVKGQKSKLICVLGACGGGRDKWKRPVLGEIAAKYCDEIIVTNEDPYDEDPWQIIEQVASGTKGKAKKILDRREAIREALKEAREGDVVIITGKGCEPSICLAGGKKIPWDDRKVVREEFNNLRLTT